MTHRICKLGAWRGRIRLQKLMSEVAAYHEAGHVVVAAELGGRVVSATLDPEAPEVGPVRDGDVTVEWPQGRSAESDVLVALAGPVAEMIYTSGDPDPSIVTAWSADYAQAMEAVSRLFQLRHQQVQHLQAAVDDLHRMLVRDDIWTVVGDVADALLAHEHLDEGLIDDVLGPWGY